MKPKIIVLFFIMCCVAFLFELNEVGSADVIPPAGKLKQYEHYTDVIQKTVKMIYDSTAVKYASHYGLNILNLTWEDTGRYENSSVGDNISDVTIQVQAQDPQTQKYQLFCMPVIRFPNFSDKTCDVKMDKFYLLVGNEKGQQLKKVTLRDFLKNMRKYLTNPGSWKGNVDSLVSKNDTHVLVSAQACFLPIPKEGNATFNPVIFNYQSYANNPAVLTILATREGTSVTIIDNKRDGFPSGWTWGQRLFFNLKGERAPLTGKRLSDFIKGANGGKANTKDGKDAHKGLNMVLLIQVPLKHKSFVSKYSYGGALPCAESSSDKVAMSKKSDVEIAVIGHGKVEGPYTEIDNLPIERDERFPVRVTIQFYKATSNGIVSDKDMAEIASQITKVYADADYVGSLVLDGKVGRPTEHKGQATEPAGWWNSFWNQYEKENKIPKQKAIEMFQSLLGLQIPDVRKDKDNKNQKANGN